MVCLVLGTIWFWALVLVFVLTLVPFIILEVTAIVCSVAIIVEIR